MSKYLPKFLFISYLCIFLMSCVDKKKCDDCPTCGKDLLYTSNSQEPSIDDPNQIMQLDTISSVDEQFEENKKKIEAKYGEQWDFCHCIVANDSLDRLVKANVELDEKFMARFEEVSLKCKAFLVMSPNITPEERAKHEKKIKQCL
jgi:hypothetical protein